MNIRLLFISILLLNLIILPISSCRQNKGLNNKNKESSSETFLRENDSIHINLDMYEKFQTFDEFNMCGIGTPTHKPYVFVKKGDNEIIVRTSDNIEDSIVYKKKKNIWTNELYIDMNKKFQPIAKDNDYPARYYLRFFINDSIFEYEECYFGEQTIKNLFVKTHKKCTIIILISSIDVTDKKDTISQIRKLIDDYKNDSSTFVKPLKNVRLPNFRLVSTYKIIEKPDLYEFREIGSEGSSYIFKKDAYGFWGIQPGFEKGIKIEL